MFVGVLATRTLLLGVYTRAPDSWKLPFLLNIPDSTVDLALAASKGHAAWRNISQPSGTRSGGKATFATRSHDRQEFEKLNKEWAPKSLMYPISRYLSSIPKQKVRIMV